MAESSLPIDWAFRVDPSTHSASEEMFPIKASDNE